MAFMQPEYHQARAYRIDTRHEGTRPFFASLGAADKLEGEALETWLEDDAPGVFADMQGEDVADIHSVERDDAPKWYCRLSAPGYMDATDWSGPYDTREEAQHAIESDYDVHHDSGEPIE